MIRISSIYPDSIEGFDFHHIINSYHFPGSKEKANQYNGCEFSMSYRQQWFIVTADESRKIREILTKLEPEIPENSRGGLNEITRIIEVVERRLI